MVWSGVELSWCVSQLEVYMHVCLLIAAPRVSLPDPEVLRWSSFVSPDVISW